MEADQKKTISWREGDKIKKLTYVRSTTTEIDEKGLRKALTAKVFDRYTVKKLDKKAMEAAMDTGEVDPVIVSKFVTLKPRKPYLTYKESEVKEDNHEA